MTAASSVAEAFAEAVAALVGEPDVADVLAHLVGDCAAVMGAEAVAILARDERDGLSLLTASSHRASELELLQIQGSAGPCIDVIESNQALSVSGADRIRERWQHVGDAIVNAGFESVEAYPMRWRGNVLGGLNVFRAAAPVGEPDAVTGQAFADIATLAVIYSMPIAAEQAASRLHEALSARDLVEQAKGVIAFVEDVDMGTAYDLLLERAERVGETLTHVATTVLTEQQR
jgi:ANTAR domain/GAF domain